MSRTTFRKAKVKDIPETLDLYNQLIDHLDQDINYPRWTRDFYPNLEYLQNKVEQDELYLLLLEDEIIGTTVLNSSSVEDYRKVDWTLKDLDSDEILLIHTFAIKDNLRGKEYGLDFLDHIKKFALDKGIKSIHLDTINGNTPAVSFYEKAGFNNLGEYELHYDETDETRFILFEKDLI